MTGVPTSIDSLLLAAPVSDDVLTPFDPESQLNSFAELALLLTTRSVTSQSKMSCRSKLARLTKGFLCIRYMKKLTFYNVQGQEAIHARLQRAPGGMWVQDTTVETRRQLVASLPQVGS